MKKIIFAIALMLGILQGAWAETYYIVELDGTTLYFKGINEAPDVAKHQYSITQTDGGGIPYWSQGEATIWPTVTTVVFEPSFAGARPTSTFAWFAHKPNLTTIVGMQDFLNTSEVTTMSTMFSGCSNLTMLDLTGFDTSKVTEMQRMFENCTHLTTILVGDGWTTSNVSSQWNFNMFNGCTSLVGQDGTTYNSENITADYAFAGAGGYLTSEAHWWSTRVADSFSDTDGTSTITLHDMGEMKLFAQQVNEGNTYSGWTILLAKDIALNPDVTNNFTSIGNINSHPFSGTFDGQGHTVRGINISGSGQMALFGTLINGTVRNLTLDGSVINSSNNSSAAGIVAYISSGNNTIENCHVTGSVSISGGSNVGGIVGRTNLGTVSIAGCTSAADVATTSSYSAGAGGIIGMCGYEGNSSQQTEVSVSDCFYHGTSVTGGSSSNYIGAIVGSYVTNGYSTVVLSNNFYTYPDATVKGIGKKKEVVGSSTTNSTEPFDDATNHAAVCTHAVTAPEDISDMGAQSGNAYNGGVDVYDNGISYGGCCYSHMLALTDGQDNTNAIAAFDGQTFDVKLRGRRLYKDGSWNTLCLPFDLKFGDGTIFSNANEYEVRELDLGSYQIKQEGDFYYGRYYTGVQDGKLYLFFKEASSITAGTPYIVKWQRAQDYNEHDPAFDHVSPVFSNVTLVNGSSEELAVNSADKKLTFQGTYAPFSCDYEDRSILLFGAANTLYYPNGAGPVSVGTCRAYFQLNDGLQMATTGSDDDDDDEFVPVGGGDVKAFVINVVGDGATRVDDEARRKGRETENDCYDLQGRKLSIAPDAQNIILPKGVYIVKGRKVIL